MKELSKASEFDKLFLLNRMEYFKDTTIGQLFLPENPNDMFCWTLEDEVRPLGVKVKRHTAITETGIGYAYEIGLRYSPAFKREVPVLYTKKEDGVYYIEIGGQTWKYILFHGGNDEGDTEGCPLVAYNRPSDTTIQGSAERELTKIIQGYLNRGLTVGVQVLNLPQTNKA